MIDDQLGQIGIGGDRKPADIWYVYLPENEDREKYIASCKATYTVSIINGNNELIHKVPVGKSAMQYIDFPAKKKELGSPVLCINIVGHNQPLVTEVFNSGEQFNLAEENEKKLTERTSNGYAEVSVRGKKGEIAISVDSELDEGGIISINVTNKSQKGKFIVNVNGELNINNTGTTNVAVSDAITFLIDDGNEEGKVTTLKYENGKGFTYLDQFDNKLTFEEHLFQLLSEKIKFGQGKEALVLGNTFADLFKDFIQEVSQITTSTAIGLQPIVNQALVVAYKEKVETILSKLTFTD